MSDSGLFISGALFTTDYLVEAITATAAYRAVDVAGLRARLDHIAAAFPQNQRTNDLLRDIPDVLRYISRYVTVAPGDVVYTGTPGNTKRMKPGDVVEVEIEGIGILRNSVRAA